jgi:hypothetical protein
MTDENTTDDTEQPSRDELAQRVEQLEQTVQQMLPSRRDALKLGGTALAAGALGSAATGSASAGTSSVGTLGSSGSPVDIELEDVNPGSTRAVNYNNNDITGVSSLSTGAIVDIAELLVRGHYFVQRRLNDADDLFTGTSGSGSLTHQASRTVLATGTTGGSHARVTDVPSGGAFPTFSQDAAFYTTFEPVAHGGTNSDDIFIAFGTAGKIAALTTQEHIGILLEGNDLKATSGDGASRETTTLSAGAGVGEYPIYIVWDSANSEAKFYQSLDPDFSSPDAVQSTNVPPSSSAAVAVTARAENGSSNNENKQRAGDYRLGFGT